MASRSELRRRPNSFTEPSGLLLNIQAYRSVPPLGSVTLTVKRRARYVVRPQAPTPLAHAVAGLPREAFSNLRNLLCVKLAYHCRNQNAL
jgi:hypothetical protein